jgi:hypothetical protein
MPDTPGMQPQQRRRLAYTIAIKGGLRDIVRKLANEQFSEQLPESGGARRLVEVGLKAKRKR